MDIHFVETDEVPRPPDQVRFRAVRVDPLTDLRRLQVSMELTPFQQPPNLEIEILDPDQDPVSSASIVGAMDPRMKLIVHLRGDPRPGVYIARLTLGYEEGPAVDQTSVVFQLPFAEGLSG
ncbi:MAG TPA: hypothetical protein VJ123_07440 [Anaerolineales bacterium]|nr:hypothetical protein [Anaerolineales bacterium]